MANLLFFKRMREHRGDRKLFGRGSVFGFKKPLLFFELLPAALETDPDQVRHTLGFGSRGLPRQKNPLHFFALPPRFAPLPAPHNRQVEDGGPTYRRPLPFKSFWAHHFF
jgi:hypothetical protein